MIEQEIILNNIKYKQIIDDEGNHKLRRYNDKTKMWININFSNLPNNIDDEITDILSKEFIHSFA